MSRVLVVGSVAFDSIETPFGEVEDALGGSALYFSNSASKFTGVDLVGVVGDDFPEQPIEDLNAQGVDTTGLHRKDGKTFRWEGRYGYDLKEPDTLDTQLNVFGDFHPEIPEDYRDASFVFLANIDPELQMEVLDQVHDPQFVALDTMPLWIENKREELVDALGRVEAEARRDLGRVTATLGNTAAFFGPLVGGATVALAGVPGCASIARQLGSESSASEATESRTGVDQERSAPVDDAPENAVADGTEETQTGGEQRSTRTNELAITHPDVVKE
jgi:hypothetical protein